MSDVKKDNGELVGRVGAQTKTNYVLIEALAELLVEKQIITKEELDQKFEALYEKQGNKVIDFFKSE